MAPLSSEEFYDRLASVFDVMTDWPMRLNHEMPFIANVLGQAQVQTVLDAACGTGWHAISLAKRGYAAAGCDASPAMVQRARANAARVAVDVRFQVADVTNLDQFPGTFDAILCLGNSLPHILSRDALLVAIRHFHKKLNPAGVIILHNLNYNLRLKTQPRFFSAEGNARQLIWRFADYGPDQITFHTALFERSTADPPRWSVHVQSTLQQPWRKQDYQHALTAAGFRKIEFFGGLDGSFYAEEESSDLVIVAS